MSIEEEAAQSIIIVDLANKVEARYKIGLAEGSNGKEDVLNVAVDEIVEEGRKTLPDFRGEFGEALADHVHGDYGVEDITPTSQDLYTWFVKVVLQKKGIGVDHSDDDEDDNEDAPAVAVRL